MAAVLCLAGIGDSTRVYWLRFSLIRPARPIRAVASVGLRVWSRLTFADAAVSGLAGRSLAGRCAMLGQVDGLGFPGADPPAVWSGWKAEPHGPAATATVIDIADCSRLSGWNCRELAAAARLR